MYIYNQKHVLLNRPTWIKVGLQGHALAECLHVHVNICDTYTKSIIMLSKKI